MIIDDNWRELDNSCQGVDGWVSGWKIKNDGKFQGLGKKIQALVFIGGTPGWDRTNDSQLRRLKNITSLHSL